MLLFVRTKLFRHSWMNGKKGKPMTINLWVNGEEYVAHSDKTIDVENPATGKVVDQLALADKHCLDQVVEIAREAQKE